MGLLEWLQQHDRLHVAHLPLALTDFLLSLRDFGHEGDDPFPIAEQAQSQQNLQRQVSFYSSRLRSYVSDVTCRPQVVTPAEVPRRFSDLLNRVADKDILALAIRQSFESMSPRVTGFLIDLRELVVNSKSLWKRGGFVSLADDVLPHRAPRTGRNELAKIIDDLRLAFSSYAESLRRLSMFVSEEDIQFLSDEQACKVALRSIWQTHRSGGDTDEELPRLNAQLTDFVTTLKSAKEVESALSKKNILANFGSVATLLEVLPQIEAVQRNVTTLVKGQAGSDGAFAANLYEQFVAALIESVESEVTSAKASLRRIRVAISSVDSSGKRIMEAATANAARFAEIQPNDLEKLMEQLLQAVAKNIGQDGSLDDTVKELEGLAQDCEMVESALGRLDDCYRQLTAFNEIRQSDAAKQHQGT